MRIRQWSRAQRVRAGAFVATLGAAVALMLLGFGATGAYFSDTSDGAITGTIGSIRIVTAGGSGIDGMNFTFNNLLPGEPQTATVTYYNSGANPQDVWLKFPNATALSALNTLGTYGEIHVVSNGTEIFASANLNDRSQHLWAVLLDRLLAAA